MVEHTSPLKTVSERFLGNLYSADSKFGTGELFIGGFWFCIVSIGIYVALYGGGTRVVDFVPSETQRSNRAADIFFTFLPAALLGVYRGQNSEERKAKERCAAAFLREYSKLSNLDRFSQVK